MKKPRFAIEAIDVVTGKIAYTCYFDITDDRGIIYKIDELRRSTRVEINRFYYAGDFGKEIEFEEA